MVLKLSFRINEALTQEMIGAKRDFYFKFIEPGDCQATPMATKDDSTAVEQWPYFCNLGALTP